MNVTIHMIGGGRLALQLDTESLEHVADVLRRERGLLGVMLPDEADDTPARVLVPAHRIQLVAED